MENKEQLLQNTTPNTGETKETPQAEQATKSISAIAHEKIIAFIQPNILPDTLKIAVSTLVEKESAEKPITQEPEKEIVSTIEIEPESGQSNEVDIEANKTDVVADFSAFNKLQLVELLEEIIENKDVNEIKEKVASIKVFFLKLNKEDVDRELEQFITDGGDKESYEHIDDPLETRFKVAFNTYKSNKAKFNEILEKQKQENLEQKKQILDELKELISSEETLKKTYDEFRVLQDKWKEIGQVPVGEITNLWNSYHFLVEKFFDKVKINRELRDLDLKKNFEAKIELCEKAEELLLDASSIKSFKLLQKLHEQWKEIGPIPHDKKDEVWERFKNATDKINNIRREHYTKIQEEQMAHYEAKKVLCEKMEEIVGEVPSSTISWQKESDEISELFKLWKSIGQAPKKLNDEIWTRFKTSMDLFFENKKEFFSKVKEQQFENYNRKLQLCVEAEALQESTDWGKTTTQLKKLQEEWKKIGPVPRRQSEKIWKRFRTACDVFFSRKSAHFSGHKEREEENLASKNVLIERIKAFEVKKERHENLEALKTFQREWVEIGHVPIRQKDAVYAEYRKAIDALFEKMKITENEISTNEYKAIVEGMRENPEARDRMRRERITLNNKIVTLRDEIALWENNIGFFANSKQADIMIAEYQKKIDRAKNDLKVLEQKLKILMN